MLASLLLTALGAAQTTDAAQEPHWPFPACVQSADGSFRADLSVLPEDVQRTLFAGEAVEDVSVTAALLWSLVGDAHSTQAGAHKKLVCRMVEWLQENAFTNDGSTLGRGEALAAGVLEIISWRDRKPDIAQASRLRILQAQTEDGGWIVDGLSVEHPRSLEATGWAAWGLRSAARDWKVETAAQAYERARSFLDTLSDDKTAAAFDLYFDVVDGEPGAAERFGDMYFDTYMLAKSPAIGLVATATAWNIGGTTWKRWERSFARRIVREEQITEGPAAGFWPASEDSRGSLWDLGMHIQVVCIYYRYGQSGL